MLETLTYLTYCNQEEKWDMPVKAGGFFFACNLHLGKKLWQSVCQVLPYKVIIPGQYFAPWGCTIDKISQYYTHML